MEKKLEEEMVYNTCRDILDQFPHTPPPGHLHRTHMRCHVKTQRLDPHRAGTNPTSNLDVGSECMHF